MTQTIVGQDLAESLFSLVEGLKAMPTAHSCLLIGADGFCTIIGQSMETMSLEDAAELLETAILSHDSERERIGIPPAGVDPGAWAAAVRILPPHEPKENEHDRPASQTS